MKKTIEISCQNCEKTHEVTRTSEIPREVNALTCNFCPDCMDEMDADYSEGYVWTNGNGFRKPDSERFRKLHLDRQEAHRVEDDQGEDGV